MDNSTPSQPRPEQAARLTKSSTEELSPRDIISDVTWPDVRLSLSTEAPEERASRLRREEAEHTARLSREEEDARFKRSQEEADSNAKRSRERLAFGSALGLLVLFFVACLWIILRGTYTSETEKWATTALISILGTVLGAFSGYGYGKTAGKQ